MADGVNNDFSSAGPIEDRVGMRVEIDAAKAGTVGRSAYAWLRRDQGKRFVDPGEHFAGPCGE